MARSLFEALTISAPCDEDLAAMEESTGAPGLFCARCTKVVHVAATMTRAEVAARLRSSGDHPPCFALFVRKGDGAILLADGYVHPARTEKRRLPVLAVAATVALAACAPPPARRPVEMVPVELPQPTPPRRLTAAPVAPPAPEPAPEEPVTPVSEPARTTSKTNKGTPASPTKANQGAASGPKKVPPAVIVPPDHDMTAGLPVKGGL